MIVNKEKFQENFKYFDKEIIVEIIDLFINEFDSRMNTIKNSIDKLDMDSLKFSAHSLKGVIANFVADVPESYARKLEIKAKINDHSDLDKLYQQLYDSTEKMVNELKEIRIIYA